MTLHRIAAMAQAHRLTILGGFHAEGDTTLPKDTHTLLLLGPDAGFWPHLKAQPEWDGAPDPIDRWSRRVIGGMACDLGAKALFPFTGPPWHPFQQWALRTGRIRESPVRLLVHDAQGLWVSFRGALALKDALDLPAPPPAPCEACAARPCLTACPPRALTGAGYDVPACHVYLDSPEGQDCLSQGCAVRRACPVSQRYDRMAEQSAWHMARFHPGGTG